MLKMGHLGGNARGMNAIKQGRSRENLWVSAFIGDTLEKMRGAFIGAFEGGWVASQSLNTSYSVAFSFSG